MPKSAETSHGGKVTILRNQQIQLTELSPTTCMLIDVAISGDRNVIKKEAEKILKYKDLTIEIQRMWNVNTKVMPVITGETGAISKSFRKYVSNIPGKHEVNELQKRSHIEHCTHTAESTNVKVQ